MIYRTSDCQRCHGYNKLLFCYDCQSWFCWDCLRHHDHEAYLDMKRRMGLCKISHLTEDYENNIRKSNLF